MAQAPESLPEREPPEFGESLPDREPEFGESLAR